MTQENKNLITNYSSAKFSWLKSGGNISQLFKNIILVLDKSIKHHGTTIINFTFDNMKTGDFRNELKVYGRGGKPCFRCKSNIVRKKIAGRSTHFCKKCQK